MPRFSALRRGVIAGAVLVLGLAAVPAVPHAQTLSGPVTGSMVELPGSLPALAGRPVGAHPATAPLAVTLVLQPNNADQIDTLENNLYDPASSQYHHWLSKGQFNAMFAPPAAQTAQVTAYLRSQGLQILSSQSPFFVRASGSTAQVEAAFGTHLTDYVGANNTRFYANDASVKVPVNLASIVMGVVGLSSTVHEHPNYIIRHSMSKGSSGAAPSYGGGPGGSGLTPSQLASIYNAGGLYSHGPTGQGAGMILAVFELSGYTRADIATYEHTYFGSGENVPLVDVNVDGGPIHPVCPPGDTCVSPPDYSGDIEVNLDIEAQIALAPKIKGILVYNAPNDYTGQTILDEYSQIAQDDLADSISSSWGLCEQDAGLAFAKAEDVVFRQMAAQGQSMFASAGDTGAFDCLRDVGSPNSNDLAVDDPASQLWVTGVGGTSFESFDPQSDQTPSYPAGFETVWNVLDLCDSSPNGQFWCAFFGAGGGGNSVFWGRPAYQDGPGVYSSYLRHNPYCAAAKRGADCREVPDVSAVADEFTPFSEYCTGDPSTNSFCAQIFTTPPGWFGVGGTSLSAPLWAAIAGIADSYAGHRVGNVNPAVYRILRSPSYTTDFHDITGIHQTENNNGYYPVTPNYDMATGVGTPNITALAEGGL